MSDEVRMIDIKAIRRRQEFLLSRIFAYVPLSQDGLKASHFMLLVVQDIQDLIDEVERLTGD